MTKTGTAFFVAYPRMIEELMTVEKRGMRAEYEIVKTISLTGIDYENFITDMVADRWFLEEDSPLSGSPTVRCLLVKQRNKDGGVLVVPENGRVKLAALLP